MSMEKEGTAAAAALVRCAYGTVTESGYRNLFIDGQNYPFVSFLEGSMEARPFLRISYVLIDWEVTYKKVHQLHFSGPLLC
jgi:hypothetical protein